MPKPRDTLQYFLGVNLRRDTLSLADQEIAAAINADLHSLPGVIRRRQGRTLKYTDPFAEVVRQIGRHNALLYTIAGSTLYRTQTSIVTGLSAQNLTTLLAYQPLNDAVVWTFIADRQTMQKDNGAVVRQWGIDPPAAAPEAAPGAAGSLTGNYRAQYTYVRLSSGKVAHESNPSPLSPVVPLSSETLDIPVLASGDAQVNRIRIYRTVAGGALGLFDQMVDNTTATITSSQADDALGAAVELDNTVPPVLAAVAEYQNHFFGVQNPDYPNYLWYSKRWRPESWPTDQFLILGRPDDPLQTVVSLTGALGVFSRRTKYAVRGNSVSGFAPIEAISTRGTMSPQSVLITSRGVAFWARDGIFATNFLQADQELTTDIATLFDQTPINAYFPLDVSRAAEFGLAEYKQRLYASYFDTTGQNLIAVLSQDTGKWYHYEHPARSLYYDETTDQLLMGSRDGFVYVAETGTSDGTTAIAMHATLATRYGGDRFTQKLFEYLRVDITVYETTTVEVYVDDILVATKALTGTRSKPQLRLPHNTKGFTWHMRLVGTFDLYAVTMLYAPLGDGS